MYEILLPVDESAERAVAQADAVVDLPSDGDDLHVTVFHTFIDNPSGASVTQIQSVRRANERLEDADVAVTLDEGSGEPAQDIVAVASDIDADLVCMGGRKRSPTGKVLFGSVTQSVLLDTDRPVMVTPAPDHDD